MKFLRLIALLFASTAIFLVACVNLTPPTGSRTITPVPTRPPSPTPLPTQTPIVLPSFTPAPALTGTPIPRVILYATPATATPVPPIAQTQATKILATPTNTPIPLPTGKGGLIVQNGYRGDMTFTIANQEHTIPGYGDSEPILLDPGDHTFTAFALGWGTAHGVITIQEGRVEIKPTAGLLNTAPQKVGARCNDGQAVSATGPNACARHDGRAGWVYR